MTIKSALPPDLFRSLILSFAVFSAAACDSTPSFTGGSGAQDSGDGDGDGDGDVSGDGDDSISLGGAAPSGDGDGDEVIESECGDGIIQADEVCDDGNKKSNDGCSGDCQIQDPLFNCSEPGEPCVNTVVCGNGVLEGAELCDDKNTRAGDGCSSQCDEVEAGFICARPGRPCVALSVCGNGARERGEQCDDGQESPQDGDGCDENCQLEEGFFCAVAGEPCVPLLCGDGKRTPNEECDDGEIPAQSGDGCSAICAVEPGFRCSASGCFEVCGDGVRVGAELLSGRCDDGNTQGTDGCSGACVVEPFFSCSGAGQGSCATTIACGNSVVEPGEICDPPGTDGCLPGCQSFSPEVGGGATCGNSVIEAGEGCDAPNPGNGCTLGCVVETGFSCPQPNVCFQVPTCGDGILHSPLGEFCDDGNDSNPSDGCHECQVGDGFSCSGLGPSTCIQEVCGDAIRTPSEQCEDNNAVDDDGCTNCAIDLGYVCPVEGASCVPRCGDSLLIAGEEDCDDGNRASGDGCNAGCRVEPRYTCSGTGADSCELAECGDGHEAPSEGCDDGNKIAGDGCGPTCQLEPTITPGPDPIVAVFCGDGLVTGSEECDDGNTESEDGCSDACIEEDHFTCTEFIDLPDAVEIAVTHRDFKVASAPGGHPDFEFAWGSQVDGIAGAACTVANAASCGRLDTQGKPQGVAAVIIDHDAAPEFDGNGIPLHGNTRIRSPSSFATWFRGAANGSDDNALGYVGYHGVVQVKEVSGTLELTRTVGDEYVYDNGAFLPLEGNIGAFGPTLLDGASASAGCTANQVRSVHQGCTDLGAGNTRDFGFTTELRYFFQYQGGETLSFTGDDDVWVFVNGKLAVDIGGMHEPESGRVVLGDDGRVGAVNSQIDSNCSVHGGNLASFPLNDCYNAAEAGDTQDSRFGLVKGEVYEIVLFQAERHTTGSNFRLTLDGFLAPRSYCVPVCGDSVVGPGEVCDDGTNSNTDDNNPGNDSSGECNESCTQLAFCGDDELNIGEECDNGSNLDLYGTAADACAPGCKIPPSCGDGLVQSAYESCDNGSANDDSSYGSTSCTTSCGFGGYCGDGIKNGGENCDAGAQNGIQYGLNSCGYDCSAGPRCGDGVRNGPEECDGEANCNDDCTYEPFCGDGVVSVGEECDWGQFPSSSYGGCTISCTLGPSCGDSTTDAGFEDCDEGDDNVDATYDACTTSCLRGPHCGDRAIQSDEGEQCDNGFNDDDYMYNATSCAEGCVAPPRCGDGNVQPDHELCDAGDGNSDSAYDGCTTSCEWGPYCGDGTKDPEETCDSGSNNTAYSATDVACGYDCLPAPYCGDGTRNGPEQCDDGAENGSDYGGCRADCTRAPYCGDGIVQKNKGEECDGGTKGSANCTLTCAIRDIVK